jgi:hypothetical protein
MLFGNNDVAYSREFPYLLLGLGSHAVTLHNQLRTGFPPAMSTVQASQVLLHSFVYSGTPLLWIW